MKVDNHHALADALRIATTTATGKRWRRRAKLISKRIAMERGVEDAVRFVYRDVPSARRRQQAYFRAKHGSDGVITTTRHSLK